MVCISNHLEPWSQWRTGTRAPDLLAGSLIEPTCVAYNAVIERGGGIRPATGVILGGGPVGWQPAPILKRAGHPGHHLRAASRSTRIALQLGADHVSPIHSKKICRPACWNDEPSMARICHGSHGLADSSLPGIERVIWEGGR